MVEDYGAWLGRLLQRRGVTEADLAQRVHVTRAAVSTWVSGRVTPRPETQAAIEEVLGARRNATGPAEPGPLTWYHRPGHADGGREYGNPAAFAFDADLSVLAREATQNSLDERADVAHPVRVKHVIHEISGNLLHEFRRSIHWDELRGHYEAATKAENKTARALARGFRDMEERESLVLLKIDDYNAHGLTGDDYEDGRFSAVVRRQLDSVKTSKSAGGSFGLGKATLWTASSLGMVLINSTLDESQDGRHQNRVIGRIELPWHRFEDASFAGPAWFGRPDPGKGGATRSWWADDDLVSSLQLRRDSDQPGTSFLIVGAREDDGAEADLQTMHERLVRGIGENFWASMIAAEGESPALEASVVALRNGREVVPERRVLPEDHEPARSRALRLYLAGDATVDRLTAFEDVVERRISLKVPPLRVPEGPADQASIEHEAVLLLTPTEPEDPRPNRLVCMRGNRMVVTAQTMNPPLGGTPYQALLLAGTATGSTTQADYAAERFLRTAEPPEHDSWRRTQDLSDTYARGAVKSISDFRRSMREGVMTLVAPRQASRDEGGPLTDALRQMLRIDAPKGPPRNARGFPRVEDVEGDLDDSGAWRLRVEISLPQRSDAWALSPVLRFVTRSGPKPVVKWTKLSAERNCEVTEDGDLLIKSGARTATFRGESDVRDHPVPAHMAGVEVDVQRAKGSM